MEKNQRRDDEIDLKAVFMALIKKIWLVVLVGLLFALLAIVGTKLFITPTYQSTTKMYVLSKQDQNMLTSSDLQVSTLLTQDYMQVIKSRTVAETVIAQLDLDMTYEVLLSKLSVETASDTRIITISVIDENPYQARDIADAVRDVSAEQIKRVMNSEAVNVVDKANIPDKKYAPYTMKNGFMAGVLGCFLVSFVVALQCVLDDTIKSSEDVEHYLELGTLGVIPLSKNEEKHKMSFIRELKRKRKRIEIKIRGKKQW